MEQGNLAGGSHTVEINRNMSDVLPSSGASSVVLSGGLESPPAQQQGTRPPRGSRRNKTVFKHVDLAAFQQTEAAHRPINITPAEFRSQTNGIPPMAIRNSEYAPVTGQGQDMNKTFSNAFQSFSAQGPKNFMKNEFAMKDDEFPRLK